MNANKRQTGHNDKIAERARERWKEHVEEKLKF